VAVGAARDDISERASAVDPELPAAVLRDGGGNSLLHDNEIQL
jgi:hypothetical protein